MTHLNRVGWTSVTRRALALAVALVLLLVVALGRRRAERRAEASTRVATGPADSLARRDSAAKADSVPAYDPPCFASHLGLPCQ